MINLKGKVALITGGSRGIGAACVKLFSKAETDVAFTFKAGRESAEELISNINPLNKIIPYQLDLDSESDIIQKISQIETDFGKIDILVNNAGIWKPGSIENMSREDWEETIRINLSGVFSVTKAVIPIMKKNKFGRIINNSSTAGQRGEPGFSHYAAAKGALISFTKSLAVELAEYNITTNAVAPGWVETDMTKEIFMDKDYKESVRRSIPIGRIALPKDIAGPILFLASDLARHINGTVLNINGGSLLCG
jgi:3-oxoacyl-[acyl-carrier protein] reductase